jgi:hypothetical protein
MAARARVVAPPIAEDAAGELRASEHPAPEQMKKGPSVWDVAASRVPLKAASSASTCPPPARPLLCELPLETDSAPPADPGNDTLPPDVVVILDPLGPEEVEAMAQRLAALLLGGALTVPGKDGILMTKRPRTDVAAGVRPRKVEVPR